MYQSIDDSMAQQDGQSDRIRPPWMFLYVYSAILYIIAPLVFFRLWRKSFAFSAYRKRWLERLAYIRLDTAKPRIWIHAVSMGETVAIEPMVRHLRELYPDHNLLITTTTPTGSEQVKKQFGSSVEHVYFPYDLPHVIARFLRRARPDMLILMETEIWPNCLNGCYKRDIPVVIANARLSRGSFRGYRKFKQVMRRLLHPVRLIATQTDQDRQRFLTLGARQSGITVMGNIKADQIADNETIIQGQRLREALGNNRPVVVAGSTHKGEEESVLAAFSQVLLSKPDCLLILAPRHPERFNEVADLCESEGISFCRRRLGRCLMNPRMCISRTPWESL